MSIAAAPPEVQRASNDNIASLFRFLRLVDVCDAMDGIGYFNIGLVAAEIRPIWLGMKFWGEAVTMRAVPSNRPMWKLDTTEDIVAAHRIWFTEMGRVFLPEELPAGHVIVMESGETTESGYWGSENLLNVARHGAVGVVTDGYCRDTWEVANQRSPICARRRGRTISPGRQVVVENQSTIACGGARVDPGDIIGCDDDGVVVVPRHVAEEVAMHARAILLADMHSRRKHYEALGIPLDPTVDYDAVESYYRDV